MAVFFSSGKPANDGIGAVGLSSVRSIAAGASLVAIAVRFGPGPPLPFSPILWHARQPDWAATSLPASYSEETSMSISVGEPASAPRKVRKAIAAMVRMPAVVAIIFMSLILGAELGPKADPTTTTYVPRPEWYFFFLFELLRVIKPSVLVPLATIGIPTICMILLFLLPFYDRGPERRPERRPIATAAGIFTIAAMAYLTYLGANAGSPNEIAYKVDPKYEPGKLVAAQSGCLACHKIGENGNDGPGPELTDIGDKLLPGAIQRTLENPTAPMPSYRGLPEEKKTALVDFLSQLDGEGE